MEDPTGESSDKNVAYSGRNIKKDLTIVGESNYQDSIALFKKGLSYGFMIPEEDNEFDKNAVALYLIDSNYEIHKVGYLAKDMAAKSSKSIANLLVNKGQVLPVLAKVEGGTKEKSSLGVFAYARTQAVSLT